MICQEEGGKLRKVAVKSTGKRMLDVAKCLSNKDFFIQFNTIPLAEDAIANDVEYHLKCWVAIKREVQNDILNVQDEIQELEDVNRVIADIKIVEMVRESVNSNNVIDMNTVNLTYNTLLENENEINYKKYIKSLLHSNVSTVLFSRPPCRRKPENIHSDQLNEKLVDDHSNKTDDFAAIFEVAKILQRNIMNVQWKFNGSFDDFKIPKSLATLLEWVLVGPSPSFTNESVKKTTTKYNINNIAQTIMRSTKSRKQATQNTEFPYKDTVETPFAVGLGILGI